jgi:hypothetical protein
MGSFPVSSNLYFNYLFDLVNLFFNPLQNAPPTGPLEKTDSPSVVNLQAACYAESTALSRAIQRQPGGVDGNFQRI